MVAFGSSLSSIAALGLALLSLGGAAPIGSDSDETTPKPLAHYNLRVLPLGDSITYGTKSTTGNGYRLTLFNDLIKQNAVHMIGSVKHGNMSQPENEGHPGYRIGQIADDQGTHASLKEQPDIVLLHAGTNDMIQDFEIATAPNRLGDLMDEIIAADPTTTLVVAQIIANKNDTVQARINGFNSKIPALVNERVAKGHHIVRVDMSHLLDLDTDYSGKTHPNDAGYTLMGNAWYKALEQANGMGWIKNATATAS